MGNMDRDDKLVFQGVVLDSNKGVFRVAVNENHIIICKLSGKLKLHEIRVIAQDIVLAETSPYDPTVGRITKRLRAGDVKTD